MLLNKKKIVFDGTITNLAIRMTHYQIIIVIKLTIVELCDCILQQKSVEFYEREKKKFVQVGSSPTHLYDEIYTLKKK